MKTKKLIALLVVLAMAMTLVLAACNVPHECGHVCETCQKCTDETCTDPACADKCEGHQPQGGTTHTCKHVCPTCKKCTDATCKDAACAAKCPGHNTPSHECKDKCEECGKCTTTCTDPACADKCPGHEGPVHECESKCLVCGKCTNAECEEDVCKNNQCAHGGEHGEIIEAEVTFDVGTYGQLKEEASATVTTVGGKLEALPEVEILLDFEETATFLGWFTEATGGELVDENYFFEVESEEDNAVTVYAQYHKEWTVTLSVGEGTLDGEAQLTFVTVDGKLPVGTVLPVPTSPNEHIQFKGWYTAQTNGTLVIEEEHVFTADTTIYAQYVRDDGIWNGDTFVVAMVRNTGNTSTVEYWLGGGTVDLKSGDVISFYINGKLCTGLWITGAGVKTEVNPKPSSVTVTASKAFKIFLKDYSGGAGTDYVVEFRTSTAVIPGTAADIPADAGKITVKLGSLDDIIIYLVKSTGASVTESEFGSYCIYTFEEEAFGNWTACTTKGKVQATITSTAVTEVPNGWIFRWGSSYGTQTGNIEGAIEAGGTYVIKLPASNNGAATVTRIFED